MSVEVYILHEIPPMEAMLLILKQEKRLMRLSNAGSAYRQSLIDTGHKAAFTPPSTICWTPALRVKAGKKLVDTAKFLTNYANKHFNDEERSFQVAATIWVSISQNIPRLSYRSRLSDAAATSDRRSCARSGPAESDGRRSESPTSARKTGNGQASERLIFPFYYKQI